MNTLTEYRVPRPHYPCPGSFLPNTGWFWEGRDMAKRTYVAPRSSWVRTCVVERRAGEWRWRLEASRGLERVVEARGAFPALFAEQLFPYADLAARTKR